MNDSIIPGYSQRPSDGVVNSYEASYRSVATNASQPLTGTTSQTTTTPQSPEDTYRAIAGAKPNSPQASTNNPDPIAAALADPTLGKIFSNKDILAIYEKMSKNADKTNTLKYDKDARNGRPNKVQTSKQPENPSKKNENIFKVNGELVSEEQVLKLANKIPSKIKIDETKFSITDGENTYKLIWEGDVETGEPVIINFKNNNLVNEDIEKMKHLWGFKPKEEKKIIKEDAEEIFKKMFRQVKK